MDLSGWINQAQDYVSILSNPAQSSVAAAGAAGAFSAELNNLRQAASVNLSDFGTKIPEPFKPFVSKIFGQAQSVLAGSPNNPIPASGSGTILGLNYLTAAVVGLVGLVLVIFAIGRGSR